MNTVTCSACGWVHFGVTRAHAEEEVAKFNAYFEAQAQNVRDLFGNTPASIKTYERCFSCGGAHTNMRESKPGDCPDGCTIQPIIVEHD